jgi:multicomponent Na+:H+ antiporter subunit G
VIDAINIVAAAGIVAGSVFGLLASIGIVRFPDLFTRLHAAAKAGVVGAGFILLALALVSFDGAVILRALIAILFLLLTTPISAHLLARASYMSGVKPGDLTKTDEIP